MTWIKLDDGFTEHPKILNAGRDAGWLYLAGLCYASRQLTDGVIPCQVLGRLTDLPKPERHAATLVACGLWEVVDGGWKIRSYEDHQRTKAEVDAQRDQARNRKRRQRAKTPDNVTQVSRRDTDDGHATCHADVTPPESETESETETETELELNTSSALSRVTADTLTDDEIEHIAKLNGLTPTEAKAEWVRMIEHITNVGEQVANLAGYWRVWTRNQERTA